MWFPKNGHLKVMQEELSSKEQSQGFIYVKDNKQEVTRLISGKVMEVSEGLSEHYKGCKVLFQHFDAIPLEEDGVKYYFVKEEKIVAFIPFHESK